MPSLIVNAVVTLAASPEGASAVALILQGTGFTNTGTGLNHVYSTHLLAHLAATDALAVFLMGLLALGHRQGMDTSHFPQLSGESPTPSQSSTTISDNQQIQAVLVATYKVMRHIRHTELLAKMMSTQQSPDAVPDFSEHGQCAQKCHPHLKHMGIALQDFATRLNATGQKGDIHQLLRVKVEEWAYTPTSPWLAQDRRKECRELAKALYALHLLPALKPLFEPNAARQPAHRSLFMPGLIFATSAQHI